LPTELEKVCHLAQGEPGLRARAQAKLIEVEARMADLAVIRDNLRTAVAAGCDDLHQCVSSDCYPLPFVEIAARAADALP
jgi:hypothetical protein